MSGPDSSATVEKIVSRIQSVYGGWRRHTPVEVMRRDWDNLFWSTLR